MSSWNSGQDLQHYIFNDILNPIKYLKMKTYFVKDTCLKEIKQTIDVKWLSKCFQIILDKQTCQFIEVKK